MATGTVKWFNNAKGFGFICPDKGNGDIFAHYSTIQMDGYRTLKAGQAVNYEILEGPKGYHASQIVPVENEDLG
ncbi:cold shock domain-containing protein CspD [Candidatus Enterovibrio escicola]|uniref:Cold shock-like protein CspD n=1 Tax=Candidatus Enterovibrio escicola TaxID=1927127 RepID=A0A2A5T2Z6_9GAMM|nr:cold shock domain-containing protein CspD [Candidatus Enterovibrio escacola]PCS22543.1 Cold shock protein CspD [Candidatus Enterovibrio escacola]